MRLNALLIVSLLAIVIAAPIVDALACDDCKDSIPFHDMQQSFTNGADRSDGDLLSADPGRSAQQEAGTAQDLCPVCANIAAAMVNACCGAPSLTGHTNPLPKLIAFSDPSYSITQAASELTPAVLIMQPHCARAIFVARCADACSRPCFQLRESSEVYS